MPKFYQVGVIRNHVNMNANAWGEDIFPFGVCILMFTLPPFRLSVTSGKIKLESNGCRGNGRAR